MFAREKPPISVQPVLLTACLSGLGPPVTLIIGLTVCLGPVAVGR